MNCVITVSLVLFLCISQCTNEEDGGECLDLAHCNLIQGDIAHESDKFGKDSTKYYKDAEYNIGKYTQYNQTKDESTKQECQTLLQTCQVEVSKMAVDGLNFPSKYQDQCYFAIYSRTLFECKNMKNWPRSAIDIISGSRIDCTAECLIDEDQPITLNNARKLVDIKDPIGFIAYDTDSVESRSMNMETRASKRKIHSYVQAFDDKPNDIPWSHIEVCLEKTWVNTVDYLTVGDYLVHVGLYCESNTGQFNIINIISSAPTAEIKPGVTYKYVKQWNTACNNAKVFPGTRPKSLMLGISIHYGFSKYFNYKVPYLINYLCANDGNWRYTNLAKPDSREMICANGTAICSVQGRRKGTYGHLVNVRIGCCEPANSKDIEQFVHKWKPKPITQPPKPIIQPECNDVSDNLFNLQKRPEFVFWDEVYNDIISRYNDYYSPTIIDDEEEWITHECLPGTYVNAFDLKNPKSCYFQGRRIIEITFTCGLPNGSPSKDNILSLYSRLSDGQHRLQDATYFPKKVDCIPGYFTSIQFTYYTNNTKHYFVNGWGLEMKCSRGNLLSDKLNSIDSVSFDTYNKEIGIVQCEDGKAIGGFKSKIVENHQGTFEGLYLKVMCCPVIK